MDSIERGLTAIGKYDKGNLISWVSDQTILAGIFSVKRTCVGILEQSIGARKRVDIGLSYRYAQYF
jgi:hypothetical protein